MKNLEEKLCELENVFSQDEIDLARKIIVYNSKRYKKFEEDLFQIVIGIIWEAKKDKILIDDISIVEKIDSDLAWSNEELESLEENKDNLEYSMDINMNNDLFDTLICELKRICSASTDDILDRNTNIIIDVLSGISVNDVAENYQTSSSNVYYIMRKNIEKIRLKCLRVFAANEKNYNLLKNEVEEYYSRVDVFNPRRFLIHTAEERRISQLNNILSSNDKYTINDKRTHENISDLAVVYQKQLPKKIG